MLIKTCLMQYKLDGGLVSRCAGSVDKLVFFQRILLLLARHLGTELDSPNPQEYKVGRLHTRDVGPPHQTIFGPRKKVYSST